MENIGSETEIGNCFHHGPTEKDIASTVVGIVAFTAIGKGHLVDASTVLRIIALEEIGMLDQEYRNLRIWQFQAPESSGNNSAAEGNGQPVIGGLDRVFPFSNTPIQGQDNTAAMSAFGQRRWQVAAHIG